MKAHVISCDDSIELIFIGDIKDASMKAEKLAEEDFVRKMQTINNYKEYRARYCWHVHTVECGGTYIDEILILFAELYQICGSFVSANVLDNISAASRGLKLPHETFLPYNPK